MLWTPDDLGATTREFPSLSVAGPFRVSGTLSVCGVMQGENLILNPTEAQLAEAEAQATFLVDSFKIEVGCANSRPYLKVLGSRLAETAARYCIPLIDLHVYDDQYVCFAAPQQIDAAWSAGMTLSEFIWRYVLPFLYEQAFFDKYGRWPWGELTHGLLGLLEWLGRNPKPTNGDVLRTMLCLESGGSNARKLISNRARRHHQCPCGSGKHLGKCHPDVKPGIDTIRSWIAQGKSPRLRKLLFRHPAEG